MRYYVKSEEGEVGGPFSVEELNCMIREEKIGSDCLAISDIGQTAEELVHSPNWRWMWISDVPGVSGVAVPLIERRPENKPNRSLLVALLVLVILIFTLLALASSISRQLKDLH